MKKFVDAIKHPAAPFAIFALLLVVDTILHNMQAFALCTIVGIMLSVTMVISTLCNLKAYGKVVRGIAIMLCACMVLYSVVGVGQLCREVFRPSASSGRVSSASSSGNRTSSGNTSGSRTSSGNTSGSRTSSGNTSGSRTSRGYTSGNSSSSRSSASSTSKTCYSCNGTKKCHVCNGRGSFSCPGGSCVSGKCRECRGTGVYDHGSYSSRCIVCGGDGRCNICNGTSRRDCSICHGSGRCTSCY